MFRSIAGAWARWRGKGRNRPELSTITEDRLAAVRMAPIAADNAGIGQTTIELPATGLPAVRKDSGAVDLTALRMAELERAFALPCDQIEALNGSTENGAIADDASDDKERLIVVVDAQERFIDGCHEAFWQSTERLVAYARSRDWPIIFLEYVDYGPTHQRLLDLVKGYEHRSDRVTKGNRSGAREVAETCTRLGFACKIFRVCGVFTDYCVLETAKNLALDFGGSRVEVVPAACRSYAQVSDGHGRYDWSTFPFAPNIKLVPEQGPALSRP